MVLNSTNHRIKKGPKFTFKSFFHLKEDTKALFSKLGRVRKDHKQAKQPSI